MNKLEINQEYKNWLIEIKSRIKNSQIKASIKVDLKAEFPDLTFFSQRNLYSMRQFYLFYNQGNAILHQLGAKIEI